MQEKYFGSKILRNFSKCTQWITSKVRYCNIILILICTKIHAKLNTNYLMWRSHGLCLFWDTKGSNIWDWTGPVKVIQVQMRFCSQGVSMYSETCLEEATDPLYSMCLGSLNIPGGYFRSILQSKRTSVPGVIEDHLSRSRDHILTINGAVFQCRFTLYD